MWSSSLYIFSLRTPTALESRSCGAESACGGGCGSEELGASGGTCAHTSVHSGMLVRVCARAHARMCVFMRACVHGRMGAWTHASATHACNIALTLELQPFTQLRCNSSGHTRGGARLQARPLR